MKTLVLTSDQFELAGRIIRDGGLVVFPTETVYGLGADATSDSACRAVFAAKGRPADNPLIVHLGTVARAVALTNNPHAHVLLQAFAPGPITVVVESPPDIAPVARGGLTTVALRVPDHELAARVLAAAAVPVAAPSANRSGRPSPTDLSMARAEMEGRVAAIIDGGSCRIGLESTVVDATVQPLRILRPGAITPAHIAARCGFEVLSAVEGSAHNQQGASRSPGTRYAHYRPACPLLTWEPSVDSQTVAAQLPAPDTAPIVILGVQRAATDLCRELALLRPRRTFVPVVFGDWQGYAAALYREFARAELNGAAMILAQTPAAEYADPLSAALRDRLWRAASPGSTDSG